MSIRLCLPFPGKDGDTFSGGISVPASSDVATMSSVTASDVAPFDNDVRGGEATPVVMSTEEELDRTSAEKTLESPAEGIKTKGEEFNQKELRQKELRQKEFRQKEFRLN